MLQINVQVDGLKRRQDQDFTNEYLENGLETRYFRKEPCQSRGYQEHENARDRESCLNLAMLWIVSASSVQGVLNARH